MPNHPAVAADAAWVRDASKRGERQLLPESACPTTLAVAADAARVRGRCINPGGNDTARTRAPGYLDLREAWFDGVSMR